MSLRRALKLHLTALIPLTLLAVTLGGFSSQCGRPDAEAGDAFLHPTLGGTACPVRALAFSPDGATLASGGGVPHGRGEVRLWDATTGRPLAGLSEAFGSVTAVAFSPVEALLATAGWDQPVRLWDPVT